eukprot:CAMPEP_0119361380 /NCGR_PEP_ID=MMETSP1334-20130426/8700_1 /TAXON_ID=127549 /ORGANISM="Calcidiscus leptoporus, Strain RCC1130" /LENGTH=596 /DNA_ID=CAMNT_0007376375 /DNA_START=16 /DNA_END=1806 /DNA_ORIENTATION=-
MTALSNDAFRNMLTAEDGKAGGGPASRHESKVDKQAKQAKSKAAHERRVEKLHKKQEALANKSQYRDRAEERRKELSKSARDSGQGLGLGPDAPPMELVEEEDPLVNEMSVPSGPTFAQVGSREDLSQQQHRLSIAQSKYLGGDIEHTHLVKGLDYALLLKQRAELTKADEAAEAKRLEREAQRAARLESQMDGRSKPAADKRKKMGSIVGSKAPEPIKLKAATNNEMARGVLRSLSGPPSRPSRPLVTGRLIFMYDLAENSVSDTPTSLVRAEDDLGIVRRRENMVEAALQAPLLGRLAKVMAYVARGGSERSRKQKKDKLHAPTILSMKPLKLKPAAPPAAKPAGWSAAAAPKSVVEPVAIPAGRAAVVAAPKSAENDVDDIFGDGSGSDYVCKPTEKQSILADTERKVKAALREQAGFDDDGAWEPEADAGDASALLASALSGGRRKSAMEVVDDDDDDEALIKERKAGSGGKKKPASGKTQLPMGEVAKDSYAECFPDSFEGYNLELHGPDSDDEDGVVRSTKKVEETEEEAKGSKGGKRGVDRDAQRKDAKMSRDLVQIEKLMEERKKKRQKRDGEHMDDSGFADDQNEMF